MPVVDFEGKKYDFPEGITDEEVFTFLNEIPAEEQPEPQEPLREQVVIKKDEGVRKNKEGQHVSYRDTQKVLTGGRGHVLTKAEKKLYPKGTAIPNELVDKWFKADMEEADVTLTKILEERATHVPDEVYDILLNMTFNMGEKGMKGFTELWKAVEIADWTTVSKEMLTTTDKQGKTRPTKWLDQVGNRAVRLADRMAKLSTSKEDKQAVTTE